jgi:hypothetical protein
VQAATEALETVSRGFKTQFKRDANRICRSARRCSTREAPLAALTDRLPYGLACRGELAPGNCPVSLRGIAGL